MSEEEVPAGPPAWPGGATYSNDPWGGSGWTSPPPMSGWWTQQHYTYEPPPPPRRTSRLVLLGVFVVIFVFAASAAATAVIATRGIGGTGSTAGVEAAIVDIETTLGGGSAAAGTGIVLTSSGVVLTNDHVIRDGLAYMVRLTSTGNRYSATLISADSQHDVAVLQLQGVSGLATAPIGDSSTVQIGDSITALGNAEGRGGAPAVAKGQVTGLGQEITASDEDGGGFETLTGMIQTDAPILPGDSGGPLVNSDGKVVGMDTAASGGRRGAEPNSTQAFAIPIDTALNYAHQLLLHPSTTPLHAQLGVCVGPSTSPPGAVIVANVGCGPSGIESGSPAAGIGLGLGDVITSLGGAPVASDASLKAMLQGDQPGQKVSIVWLDPAGQRHQAMVTLAAAPQQ